MNVFVSSLVATQLSVRLRDSKGYLLSVIGYQLGLLATRQFT